MRPAELGRVLVTGGGGFLGTALIKPLVQRKTVMVGTAVTCQAGPSDNLALFGALHAARKGDVLVAATDAYMGAAITGDLVLIGSEVTDVVRALRQNGIDVTAIHSHMLTEQPRIIFLHFWANDDALKLARGLRAALDKTASTKS